MTSRQCEIAAESYSTCLLAQSGYDVFVQYGAHQQHYDLVALKGERTVRISVERKPRRRLDVSRRLQEQRKHLSRRYR